VEQALACDSLWNSILLAIDIGAVLHPKRIHAQNIILNKLNLF
jgi:hypothetical protein